VTAGERSGRRPVRHALHRAGRSGLAPGQRQRGGVPRDGDRDSGRSATGVLRPVRHAL